MATRKPAVKTVAKKTTTKKPVAAKTPAKKTTTPKAKAPVKTPAKKAEPKLKIRGKTPKDIATEKGEPYIAILSVELDPENIGNGAFELDWNEKFITNLVRAGYQLKPNETEDVIVDRWFQEVCKNVVAENYEQWEANQPMDDRLRVINRRDIGDGRTEVS
jgi:hypothetical protein